MIPSGLLRGNAYAGGRKRIFIGLLCSSCAVVCLLLLALMVLPWLADSAEYLRVISVAAGCLGVGLLVWLCSGLVFHIYTGRKCPGISGIRHAVIALFLPLMEIVGKFVGIDKTIARRSFIRVNNEFVLAGHARRPPQRILLLLPHCLQAGSCPRRLNLSLDNCSACGNCQIGLLRGISEYLEIQAAVATGGTIARRIVSECRPELIVAIACERDLAAGILDSYPVPVFGILNQRPFGPCRDTLAPMETLLEALAWFTGKKIGADFFAGRARFPAMGKYKNGDSHFCGISGNVSSF